jgi:heme exporter protein D
MMARIEHFLSMGGYAVYVWPAFAVAMLIMAALAVQSVAGYRRHQRELARLEGHTP